MQHKKWVEPQIVNVEDLPEAWGHCHAGSTESKSLCANGSTTLTTHHACRTGGATTTCLQGNTPG